MLFTWSAAGRSETRRLLPLLLAVRGRALCGALVIGPPGPEHGLWVGVTLVALLVMLLLRSTREE